MTPDLPQVHFAVLWKQCRETALLEERLVRRVRGSLGRLVEREDGPVVNVVRVPRFVFAVLLLFALCELSCNKRRYNCPNARASQPGFLARAPKLFGIF